MPRKGRIEMVGKFESREVEVRIRELRELAAELHREWRERQQEWPDVWDFEMPEDRAA